MFAVSVKNTPLFSEKELEMVLLPGSVVTILSTKDDLLLVETEEYRSVKQLYIDRRNVKECAVKPPERVRVWPARREILERLHNFPKLPYVWGGNVLTPIEYQQQIHCGVDCSGLLYAVTNGCTPRNSGDIYNTYPEVKTLKPLDLIVWPGHVMIALSYDTIIESRGGEGVILSPMTARLREVEKHTPRFVRF